jgi:hypothetical protein
MANFVDVDKVAPDAARDGAFSSWLKRTVPAEEYDTEEIRFIKASGLIPEGVITLGNGCVTVRNEDGSLQYAGLCLDPGWDWRNVYVDYRDKDYRTKLEDEAHIRFEDETTEKEEPCGLYLQAFTNGTYKLAKADEVVIPASYANIYFAEPNWEEHVMFKLVASDKMKGFTRAELAIRVMNRWRMMHWLCFNFDLTTGKPDPAKPSHIFAPVLRETEYTHNGLEGLRYNKAKDVWVVECIKSA